MATVYVEKEAAGYIRMTNNTGAALVAEEFAVIGGIPCVAQEGIANGSVGTFNIGEGVVVQADSFVTSEGTFGTVGAEVYWSASDKAFSDTWHEGYYRVGRVIEILSSGVIRFAKYGMLAAMEANSLKVDRVIVDAATDYSTTGKATSVPIGATIVDMFAVATATHASGTATLYHGTDPIHTAVAMAAAGVVARMAAGVDSAELVVTDAVTIKTNSLGDAGIVIIIYK
jgi:hypothetical protein